MISHTSARRAVWPASSAVQVTVSCFLCAVLLPSASAAQFRIAAVGDSFTQGWDPLTKGKTPYADTLRPCLRNVVNWRADIVVETYGVGWASVLRASANVNLTRMVINFANAAKSKGTKYDFVVLWLAGVNDLVNSRSYLPKNKPYPYQDVLKKYQFLWDTLTRDAAHRVLIMTQPSFAFDTRNGRWETSRRKLSGMLKAKVRGSRSWQLHLLDLVSMGYDAHHMTPQRRKQIFAGGIHLTKKGYEGVGNLVCRFMSGWAKQAAGISNKRNKAQQGRRRA